MEYKLRCASFFAGVGGIELGFKQTGCFDLVYANELDESPVKTYELNFKLKVDNRSICDVQPDEIPDFDVMLAGFPCTDISIAGEQKGLVNEDGTYTRSGLFFELIRILKYKKPRIVFLENVKNLINHNNGKTLETILNSLQSVGYKYISKASLNAMEYGNIPQNRERIYIVAFKNEDDFINFKMPDPIRRTNTIKDVVDYDTQVDDKYYYTPEKYKDVYDKIVAAIDDDDAIYQYRRVYVRKNKSGVIPTLTANQGEGGHNVCIIKTRYGIRKMTPHECFNAQGFPKTFKLPYDTADSKLYKQAGNSVCVPVIKRIANNISFAIEKSEIFKDVKTVDTVWIANYIKNLKKQDQNQFIKMMQSFKEQKTVE